MAAVTIHSDFRAHEEEICNCFHFFPFCLPCRNGAGCHDVSLFHYLVLSWFFHSPPSLSSRDSLIPLCFLPLEWYLLHIWGCWCFYCLSWFQLVTHLAPHFSWVNQTGWQQTALSYPFSILNQSIVPYRVLTIASWPAYRFLGRQVRWSDIPISLRAFHSLSWSTQSKALVHETEIDVFLKFPCFLYNPANVDNLILVPLPFLNFAWTVGSSWFS